MTRGVLESLEGLMVQAWSEGQPWGGCEGLAHWWHGHRWLDVVRKAASWVDTGWRPQMWGPHGCHDTTIDSRRFVDGARADNNDCLGANPGGTLGTAQANPCCWLTPIGS